MLLIVLAIIFFIMEMKVASYGLLSVAGVVSLLLGSLMLFEGTDPDMKLSWSVLLPTLLVVSGFFIVVAGMVFKVQISKPSTGNRGLIGEVGLVKKACAPEGKVFVHGELWNAVSAETIEENAKVEVIKVNGLVLEVKPLADNTDES